MGPAGATSRTFTDPTSPGTLVTSVSIVVGGTACGGSPTVNVALNGTVLGTFSPPNSCSCAACDMGAGTTVTLTNPAGIPGYVSGGTNTVTLTNTSTFIFYPSTAKVIVGAACPASPSFAYSQTYTMAGCPPGTKGQWNNFGYTAATPQGTEIKFAVQTGAAPGGPWAPLPAGPWAVGPPLGPAPGVQIADVPIDHPGGTGASGTPSCTASGPSPCGNNCAASIGAPMTSACPASCKCPIDLLAPLSSPAPLALANAQQPALQLNSVLTGNGGSCLGVLSPGLLTTSTGSNGSCVADLASAGSACATNRDCQQDSHCDIPTLKCVWNAPTNYFDPACVDRLGNPGIDLTLGVPCYGSPPAFTNTATVSWRGTASACVCTAVGGGGYTLVAGGASTSSTFTDPGPGSLVTSVSVDVGSTACGGSPLVQVSLNGTIIGTYTAPSTCSCAACDTGTVTLTNAAGIPGYVYGGINTITLRNVSAAISYYLSTAAITVSGPGTTGYQIPICNRGPATVPAGTPIHITDDGNGGKGAWNCTGLPQATGGANHCQYNLPRALGPGACIDINTGAPNVAGGGPPYPNGGQCAVLQVGKRDLYLNWDLNTGTEPVAECGTNNPTAPAPALAGANGTGAGCTNNSTSTKTTGANCGAGGTNSCAPPATAPAVPSLSSWTVTYSCVPAE